MQQDQTGEQEIANANNIQLSVKEDDPQDQTVENLADILEREANKNDDNLFDESIAEKKLKKEKLSSPSKPRRPSDDFNLNYKPTQKGAGRKVNMIDYIEESFKLSKKRPEPLPPLPKKQLFLSLVLMAIGVTCLLIAATMTLDSSNPRSGIALWVIGGVCGLPGIFYAVKFCKAYYAKSSEERRKALEEVPLD